MTNQLPRYLLMAIYGLLAVSMMSLCSQRMAMNEMINNQWEQVDQMNQYNEQMMMENQQMLQQMAPGYQMPPNGAQGYPPGAYDPSFRSSQPPPESNP